MSGILIFEYFYFARNKYLFFLTKCLDFSWRRRRLRCKKRNISGLGDSLELCKKRNISGLGDSLELCKKRNICWIFHFREILGDIGKWVGYWFSSYLGDSLGLCKKRNICCLCLGDSLEFSKKTNIFNSLFGFHFLISLFERFFRI